MTNSHAWFVKWWACVCTYLALFYPTQMTRQPLLRMSQSSLFFTLCSSTCFQCFASYAARGSQLSLSKKSGTMATVKQTCKECGESFEWKSQPLVFGRTPAGNILLSFGILMADASISRVLLALKHMGLSVYSTRTYFRHQKEHLFPAILHFWEDYQSELINQLKRVKSAVWSFQFAFECYL